jgi:hypothetical protein
MRAVWRRTRPVPLSAPFAAAFVTVIPAACGGLLLGGDDGRSATDGGIDAATDVAVQDDATTDSPVVDVQQECSLPNSPQFRGSILATGHGPEAALLASFISWNKAIPPAGLGSCQGVESGSCCFVAAASPYDGVCNDGLPVVGTASAGTLTVTIDGDAGTKTTVVPTGAQYPTTRVGLWQSESVTVTGAGATVHPFLGEVTVPSMPSEISPDLVPSTVISLHADWTLKWTPDGTPGERVTVDVESADPNAMASIGCNVPDSSGAVTVPAALLGMMRPTNNGTVVVARYATDVACADNAAVSVCALTSAASGTVTLQ